MTHRCAPCARIVREDEARILRARETEMLACPTCGGALVHERSRVVLPLHEQLLAVLRWPLAPSAAVSILGVAVVTTFLSFFGGYGAAFAHGIRCLYLFAVLRDAALGRPQTDLDPGRLGGDLYDWITRPALRMLTTFAVAFGPAVVAHLAVRTTGLTALLALAGAAYLPAALIVTAHDDRFEAALNPVLPLRIIRAIPRAYAITCGFLAALASACLLAVLGGAALGGVTGAFATGVLGFVPLVLAARMLGVLVDAHDEELVA